MGLAKQMWMEKQEEEYLEAKAEWIREQLGIDKADESHPRWAELSEHYDTFERHPNFEDSGDDWSVVGKTRIEIFDENIDASLEILKVSVNASSYKNLLVMLHAHIVTTVEAYLSSTFIEKALSAELYMRRLVETDPEFANRKFTIQEIFNKHESLRNDLSRYLKDLIFHDIAKVKPMYLSVLNIDFGEISWLFQAVSVRHHCVHRAGYDKDGKEVLLTKISIEKLADECSALVHKVESAVLALPEEDPFFWKL